MWACIDVLLSLSLAPSAPLPQCAVAITLLNPHLQCRGFPSIGPSSQKFGSWCQCTSFVLFIPSRVTVFCTSCYLSMHNCLSCSLWEALVSGKFAIEDFLGSSEPMSPWLMQWSGDSILSSASSAILCWTQLIIQVLLMWKLKKWNGWVYSIFILAIWFSTNCFWGVVTEKIRAFPRNISYFGKEVTLFTPSSQC